MSLPARSSRSSPCPALGRGHPQGRSWAVVAHPGQLAQHGRLAQRVWGLRQGCGADGQWGARAGGPPGAPAPGPPGGAVSAQLSLLDRPGARPRGSACTRDPLAVSWAPARDGRRHRSCIGRTGCGRSRNRHPHPGARGPGSGEVGVGRTLRTACLALERGAFWPLAMGLRAEKALCHLGLGRKLGPLVSRVRGSCPWGPIPAAVPAHRFLGAVLGPCGSWKWKRRPDCRLQNSDCRLRIALGWSFGEASWVGLPTVPPHPPLLRGLRWSVGPGGLAASMFVTLAPPSPFPFPRPRPRPPREGLAAGFLWEKTRLVAPVWGDPDLPSRKGNRVGAPKTRWASLAAWPSLPSFCAFTC